MLTLKTEAPKSVQKVEPKTHFIQKVISGDTWLVMAQSAVEVEDEWSNLYYTTSDQSKLFLSPPFDPISLLNFTNTNNILKQCIEAMEVNIDGTGFSFVGAEEGTEPDEAEKKMAEGFFSEPYPNESFIKIRRKFRSTLESVGYAFLEVLRNMAGDVVGLRNVETHNIRFVKLDEPVLVKKTVMRGGKEVELSLWERERRFAQRIAQKDLIYFRAYGSTREINRRTGEWESDDNPVAPEDRGTELLVYGVSPDTTSPYYVPRWINQLPSVIGSRKAEEQNLQFLDSGGLPPAIIFVQGGTLAKDASDQLRMYLSGQNKNKFRAIVVEAQSSSGSLDAAGSVQVKVERFGSQAAQDAMFMKYDESTEEHIRKGFRLPELFIGKSDSMNFATAVTSYLVAEAQVFAPERDAFDDLINKTIVKELGFKTLKVKSKPITIADIASQLKGLELSKDMATRESFLKEVNIATGMSLALAALPQPDSVSATITPGGTEPKVESTIPEGAPTVSQIPHEQLPASTRPPSAQPQHKVIQLQPKTNTTSRVPSQNKRTPKAASELVDLAQDFAAMRGITQKREVSPERSQQVLQSIATLTPEDQHTFDSLIASYLYAVEGPDDPDLVTLAGVVQKFNPNHDPHTGHFASSGGSTGEQLEHHLNLIYGHAEQAKQEIDQHADEVAKKFPRAAVVKAPLKSKERAKEKIEKEYQGDHELIKDIARNTIVCRPQDKEKVLTEVLQKYPDAKVKVQNSQDDFMGYSGILLHVKAKNGHTSEMQINSPEMVYAKGPKEMVEAVLSKRQIATIHRKSGLECCQGHHYYEQVRALVGEEGSTEHLKSVETASREYYGHFYNQLV